MSGRVRVLLHLRTSPDGIQAVENGYHAISNVLAGTPGLLGNELLRDVSDPGRLVVLSEWETLAAFRAWEKGSAHRQTTSPLRDFQDGDLGDRRYGIYEVTAVYHAEPVTPARQARR
jgi:heme oxygenase (mycobilin-producing)